MTTAITHTNSTILGGYRVKFTNYNHEVFFRTFLEAKHYSLKFESYGYKIEITTFNFQVGA